MADGRHNANHKIANEKSSDFGEIWYTKAGLELDDSHVTNTNIFKIQDGGRQPYWKRFFAVTQQPIVQF